MKGPRKGSPGHPSLPFSQSRYRRDEIEREKGQGGSWRNRTKKKERGEEDVEGCDKHVERVWGHHQLPSPSVLFRSKDTPTTPPVGRFSVQITGRILVDYRSIRDFGTQQNS